MLTHSEAVQISVYIITLVLSRHRIHVSSYDPSVFGKNLLLAPAKLLCCSPLTVICYDIARKKSQKTTTIILTTAELVMH